jgi:Domain of unknown function (DUF4336)
MLTAVDRDVWIAEGPTVSFFGFPYPTRMALVRLANGELWVWSPIDVNDELKREVAALGPVRHVVSPNKLHHLFLSAWAQAWPEAKLYASPGLVRKRADLRFAAELGDEPDPAWARDIDQVIFRGSFAMEEVVFFHRSSRSALITDLVQKFEPSMLRGWRRWLMQLDGMVGPGGSTPREWRLSFWNREAARRALRKALAWNPERLIIAHGTWVPENGREILRRSLAWLGD